MLLVTDRLVGIVRLQRRDCAMRRFPRAFHPAEQGGDVLIRTGLVLLSEVTVEGVQSIDEQKL